MLRRLKAAISNSLVWGAAWSVGSVTLATILTWLGVVSVQLNPEELFQIATWYGVVGVIAGGAFSSVLPIAFRGRDVLSVKTVLFVIGGAAAGALLAPFLPGPAWVAVLLGAGTAGGTLSLAKSAARQQLAASEMGGALPGEVR